MTDLTPNHPAVEAAQRALASDTTSGCVIEQHEGNGMWTCFAHGMSADGPEMCWYVRDMPPVALAAALPHLTADDLRNTPAGKQLMAEAWEEGAEAGERDYATALDPDHECIPNPYRKEGNA